MAKEYPNINLVGAEDGYFTDDLELVARRIAKTQPDMVFAALGFPKQEQLLANFAQKWTSCSNDGSWRKFWRLFRYG